MEDNQITQSSAFTNACFVRASILRTSAEINQYKSWNPKFCVDEINGAFDRCSQLVVDPNALSEDEMINLGFLKFSDNFYLIPLWLINNLPNACFLTCITGESRVFNKNEIDNMFGMLAYGVKLVNKG